jgi:hypothetical protein
MRLSALAMLASIAGVSLGVGSACSQGQTADSGVTEPLQISGAQFVSGPLPGTPPADAGSSEAGADSGAPGLAPLSVTTVTFSNAFIVSGLSGTAVSGLTTSDAVAIGVQLANKGTGYWVLPVQGEDVQFPGQRDFSFTASFNPTDTPGDTDLRVVAIGKSGSAGLQVNAPICLESRVPDNGHACFPHEAVPAAVISLTWDNDFDLDLTVITPSGRNVNPKTDPTTASVDSGVGPVTSPYGVGLYDGMTGVIDRDSMGECVVDGWREEDLVFQDFPATGTYLIYADPFEACGQESVRFNMTIWLPGSDGNLHASFTQSGELLASQVTGGEPPDGGTVAGLFVAMKEFE